MHPLAEVLDNRVLLIAIAASIGAQCLKLLLVYIQSGQIRFNVLFETGGMPSSHSAVVSALATGIGKSQGWDTAQFAIASIFAFIVMYDASGVRRAAGTHAKVLNQIIGQVFENDHHLSEDPLKELLGHTPVQVVVGSILGICLMWILL
jgi:acid phosphatase family membrane protein YuiD